MSVQESIQDPLATVSQLFDTHMCTASASPLDFDPSSHFANLFNNQQDLLKIPSVNHVPATSLKKNSLVRFRCMLQDTGLGQEMFITTYKKHENGVDKTLCYRYTDDLVDMDTNQENMIPSDQLAERSIVYCVSPPGQTRWAKDSSCCTSDVLETLNDLNIQEAAPSPTSTLKQKFPLADVDHVSAIVKFYDNTDSLRVGQLVDIIGVLGKNTPGNMDVTENTTMDEQELFDSHLTQQYKDTTVIHAITYTTVQGTMETPFFTKTQLDNTLNQAQDIRGPLIDYIATCFGDDKLVAEYVLLQLLSRVSSQRHGLKIGQFCLNISNFQSASDNSSNSFSRQAIIDMVSSLVLHQVFIPLTLDTLNKSRFSPQSINEDLQSGVLQLVPGTSILVDESELSEGQLGDTGVRNMQALMNAIQHQTLAYSFPYSQFDFDVDLGFITLSTRKSLLPNHCTITMKPNYPLDQTQPENRSLPNKQQLEVFRQFVQASRLASYEIPEHISQYIQDDFVKERKQAADQHLTLPSQEDLMLRMSICRLVAQSFGEQVLTKDTYDYAVQLEQKRKLRNMEQ